LSGFQQIVACGIEDAQVSTISAELDRQIGAKDLLEPVKQAMMATLISR
jgi:lipoate-protein ligase B